ncbi:PKS-NRPS hybrid synthetase [Phytophthora citrophthora]|uniref:PKS-NRPS hybrid synthetase n=1 Tax=Phytophthora citrophthora TaxID=4793 RepID=A0AAD9GBR4_9STRA|nr:PKS-NRPS hybrid synthetase [Phytophthora citrophthora]
MDYTYKTNTYDLPLLNIGVMTNMNMVLQVAQWFLPGEKEEDFIWYLQQLKEMIEKCEISMPSNILTVRDQACMNALDQMYPDVPALVGRWHMNQNVLAKTRTVLGQVEDPNSAPGQDTYENIVETSQFMDLYYKAADLPDEDEFVKCCAEIRNFNSELADYLDLHWWKYKTKVMRCWTSQYLHFGYRDTSSVEGTRSKCKKWLVSSKGNLLTAFEKFLPWWKACSKNTSLDIERDVGNVLHILQNER